MQDAKTLILDYLEDNLPAEDVTRLEQWISEDIANARLYLRLAADERAISKLLNQDEVGSLILDLSHQNEPEADLLPELLKLEAAAQPLSHDMMVDDGGIELAERSTDAYRSTLTILGDSGFWGYLAGSALRSKPVKWAGAAAVLLLAATLVFVFTGGPSQGPGVAETNIEPDPVAPAPITATNSIVATLTATHNAVWSQNGAAGALAPGSHLRAGDRITLTAGFAEITTNSGAVAILEAPATVEFLDNDNALRLHTGRLVGICETESSKGFLVRTPHMDVVDLGTRFGVDASIADVTEVYVFTGAVKATANSGQTATSPSPMRLVAGESAGVSAATPSVVRRIDDTDRFTQEPWQSQPPFTVTGDAWRWHGDGLAEQATSHPTELGVLHVSAEGRGFELSKDVMVDVTQAHAWDATAVPGQYRVEQGQRVDVYLLHIVSDGQTRLPRSYELTFDQPILGVACTFGGLSASDDLTGASLNEDSTEIDQRRGGSRGLEDNDYVQITNNGRTLSFQINVTHLPDQVRVMVQSPSHHP